MESYDHHFQTPLVKELPMELGVLDNDSFNSYSGLAEERPEPHLYLGERALDELGAECGKS